MLPGIYGSCLNVNRGGKAGSNTGARRSRFYAGNLDPWAEKRTLTLVRKQPPWQLVDG